MRHFKVISQRMPSRTPTGQHHQYLKGQRENRARSERHSPASSSAASLSASWRFFRDSARRRRLFSDRSSATIAAPGLSSGRSANRSRETRAEASSPSGRALARPPNDGSVPRGRWPPSLSSLSWLAPDRRPVLRGGRRCVALALDSVHGHEKSALPPWVKFSRRWKGRGIRTPSKKKKKKKKKTCARAPV